MFRKPDIRSGLKAVWFGLTSLLLGPFALWFLYIAKLRRRELVDRGMALQASTASGLIAFSALLFWAPLHWSILLFLYLASAAGSAWAMTRPKRIRFFALGFAPGKTGQASRSPGNQETGRASGLGEALVAAALAAYPLVYLVALLRSLGELQNFSIHLPSDVYLDGFLWLLYATPGVGLAGFVAWKAGYRPGLRTLVFFYAGVAVVLGWIMVWERCDIWVSAQVPGSSREAMLFGSLADRTYRSIVKAVFYGGAFVLGVAYLAGSRRSAVFAKRAVFLGLPSLLAYVNMLFALGDWNFFLDGLRERALEGHQYGMYRLAARAELARVPASYGTPNLLDDWAELEYQSGDRELARRLLTELKDRCGRKAYFAKLRKRAESELSALERAKPAQDAASQLDLPVIKPASYLDQEWYALLSAVAFLKPAWSDLELKKRLLDLSNTVQLHLPKLENVPELIPALRQLEIPATPCFLDAARMRKALSAGKVPFISLYGHWVPVSGYDTGRDGFYYYGYGTGAGPDWLRNEDIDLFYARRGETFGGAAEKARSRALRLSLQKFVPRAELEAHVMDIGGVGLILGDSAFAPRNERQAAFLVEQGDVYYQEHENYPEAAAAYRSAGELFPCEQIDSRKIYLKRRYEEFASDTRAYQNLFQEYPPAWFAKLGPDAAGERAIVGKILAGKLGTYLMMNWYSAPAPDSSEEARAGMDTAMALFRGLHRLDPDEPIYVDSLATLSARAGNLAAADSLYGRLSAMYPFGSESAEYRWAWVKLRMGKTEALPPLLARCGYYAGEAKYLTMRAAVCMRKHRWRAAHAALARSLKLDKSIGETHALLADWYKRKGDEKNRLVHQRWLRRST